MLIEERRKSEHKMSMRHRYPEVLPRASTSSSSRRYIESGVRCGEGNTSHSCNRNYHDAANWFQKRKKMLGDKIDIKEFQDESLQRAKTAPSSPILNSDENAFPISPSRIVTPTSLSADKDKPIIQSHDIERPSTGRLVRQCMKCKVLYTVSHYCTLHSASAPTLLLQPIPRPVPKRSIASSQARVNPYTHFLTSPVPASVRR